MADDFASAASRLAGLTGALLAWTPAAFWAATPAELAAILTALEPPSEAPADAVLIARLKEQHPDG